MHLSAHSPRVGLALVFRVVVLLLLTGYAYAEDVALDFFAGGSIFGSSYEIKVAVNGSASYRESIHAGQREISRFERLLTEKEREALRTTIRGQDLLTLPSQDFTKDPLLPDQAYYRVTVSLGGKENSFRCGMPLPDASMSDCQQRLERLWMTLNNILAVEIQ